MGFPHLGDKARVSVIALLPHRACFHFSVQSQSSSIGVGGHVQFPGDFPLEDSRSFARGSNQIIVMGHLSGLEVPDSSHIHQPRLQVGLFLVEESQQRGAEM
jgi:hypothetical protein